MQQLNPDLRLEDLSDSRRLQLLIDAVSDYAVYMLNPEGVVSSWNTGAEKLKGYRAAEIIGQHFSRFFTPEDRESGLPERMLREAREQGRSDGDGWRVRKDGSLFWANTVLRPVRDEAGQLLGFAKVARDITERRAAQEALRESERRFRLLVEGVVDYTIYMVEPSGIVSNWNAGAQRLMGYTADEIVGQHFSRFYTREDRLAGLPVRLLATASGEGRYESEGWRVRKDGSRFWASVTVDAIHEEDGGLLGFAKITRDITERRAAQDALRDSERQLRLLVRGVTDYALYMLDPNGIITSWNAGAERIKGYTTDEILGQHFSRFYTEPERAAGLPMRALIIATETGRYEAEGRRVRKDGTLFWASVVIDPIHDEQGRLVGFAKITRDITERREAQLALEQAQVQRAHNQRMEALGQLTGGVAHDFNNLLMIVSGHIATLKRLADGDAKGLRAAAAIETAAKRGETLTRQLLTFSRRQMLNPEVVDLAERVQAAQPMIASSVGAPVRLAALLPPGLWAVRVDVSEFELALINLSVNARDAMPEGGMISFAAENVTLRPEQTMAGLEGDFVALTVVDTGTGIAEDVLPRVFDPFFTTKQADKGTGLGLSQVHGFVHQAGGTVDIRSRLGQGTEITLYLPRVTEKLTGTTEEPAAEVAPATGTVVLLVEDNADVAEAAGALVEQLGYSVTHAADPSAALRAMEQQTFDLVVSDIVMAGAMGGIDLARAIRRLHPGQPILLVTGYSHAVVAAEPEFPVLRKPYAALELGRMAARLIGEARRPVDNLVRMDEARRALENRADRHS